MAVFGIWRTNWVARPRYSPRLPSSFHTRDRVCQKVLYLLPSSRSLVLATSWGYATQLAAVIKRKFNYNSRIWCEWELNKPIVFDVAPATINSRKSLDVFSWSGRFSRISTFVKSQVSIQITQNAQRKTHQFSL